jgi:hypothetical protein
MASSGGEVNADLLSSSPHDENNFSPVFNHLTSPRNQTSESSEKSDNSLSDVEENVPREFELSEQYGRTPPSSRTFTKPSKERTRSTRRKKDKPGSEFRSSPSTSWRRRQSASATSSERAFNRSMKEEESSVILVNGGEETPFKPRNRSLTESSLSRKPSQRKFQSIRYRESTLNVVNSVHFKENKAAVCPLERVKFYETMNMLVNLGGNTEGKENSVEETENYEIEELREALWLELQAWRNSTTMLNQDEWLMNERKKINTILDNVIYFNVDKTQQVNFDVLSSDSETDSQDDDDEGCCVLHPICSLVERSPSVDSKTNDLAYYTESKLSTSSDLSGTISTDEDTYKLSDFAQTIKTAVKQVSSTLDKLYSVEQLYPSHGALSKDFEKYTSEEFQASCDTLVLWLNQIKGLYHKLHVMSWLVHVDFDDEKVWKDWIDLGISELPLFVIFLFLVLSPFPTRRICSRKAKKQILVM